MVTMNESRSAGPCLHGLIEAQAERTPELMALAFEQQKLSYRELDRRANQLAHRLRALGVGPEMPVGLCVERSLDMVIAMLGILKAGGAYLPIDAAFPRDRIEFILADAKVAVLLTHSDLLARLPDGGTQIVCLDECDWTGGREAPQVDVTPGNLAYVIYTSGSTGRPKGVCVEHRNIVSYVSAIVERLRFEPGMNHATVSTIAADLGNTVIFPALATGGCLHVISQQRAENQGMLAEYFKREHIDVLKIVPSHLAALQSARNPDEVMPTSRLILGGEASRLDWIAELRSLAPGCEIYNHYGPTETTVGVLTYRLGPELPATPSGNLPMGRPLPNSRVHILDDKGQPVPDGELGELYIGGAGVARGYLNRPELTAEKFVADPFGADPAARLYRSGDLVRRLADGNIEFRGRIDDQVKVHGYRIELGEIESALREHAGVREAVVLARDDGAGAMQLAAYVVPQRPQQPLWGYPKVHILPDGAPVAHLNRNETDYLYHEVFVLQAYLRHGITLDDGDCVVDAGANIGLFTVFANRLARRLRVVAFEPNPTVFECLKANAAAWGSDVKCLPLGLSRENTSAELTFFKGLSLLSGFYADAATERSVVENYVLNQRVEGTEDERSEAEVRALIDECLRATTVSAQVRTLSSIIAEEGVERIDLLKVNVEKSELDVLLGIGPDDWPRIRQVVIEVDLDANLEPITTMLEQRGYDVLVDQDPLLNGTALRYVYASRMTAPGSRLARQDTADAHVRVLPPAADEILTPPTLHRYLGGRLPAYMIPAAFVLMEKLPLTPNGKLDRQALPLPVASDKSLPAQAAAAPRSETEKALCAIWSELLKVDNVGIHDDFFDLGGQSLTAIRAVSRIRDTFRVDIPLRNLFEHPTVAELAETIDALSWLAKGEAPTSGMADREEVEV